MRVKAILNSRTSFLSKMKKVRLSLIPGLILLLLLSGYQANATDPVVTVRFANPEYIYETQTYSLDVEFQSDLEETGLFGMNVRFFYPDRILEFISFGEFATGYAPMSPNPPIISTGGETSGMILFGFEGPQEYLNGAFQKTGSNPIILSTTGWTKIFNVSFHVDDTNSLDIENFCPPVIWDLNEAQSGGIAAGIIITVSNGSGSAPAIEHCIPFNWQYDGIEGYPHGYPAEMDCISTIDPFAVPDINMLQDITVHSGESACYDAIQTIITAGDGTTFIVETGGDINLIAGQNILLKDGTLVASGGHLLAAITLTENFCGSYESSIVSSQPSDEERPVYQDLDGQRFKIFPNPTTGNFTLWLGEPVDGQDCYLQVSSMIGNLIIHQKLENTDYFNFDLTGQNPGIYIVRILRGDQIDTYKLVKQ